MSAKMPVNTNQAYRLLHPMHTVLVSCVGNSAKPNITTLAWAMPTSANPPLVAISIAPGRHSHTLIEQSGEFIVNIPTLETLQAVYTCGNLSGRSFDKFKKCSSNTHARQKGKGPSHPRMHRPPRMRSGRANDNRRPHNLRGQNRGSLRRPRRMDRRRMGPKTCTPPLPPRRKQLRHIRPQKLQSLTRLTFLVLPNLYSLLNRLFEKIPIHLGAAIG